jgi:hypothetical protein
MVEAELAHEATRQESEVRGEYTLTRGVVLRTTGFPIEIIQSLSSTRLAAVVDRSSASEQETAAAAKDLLASGFTQQAEDAANLYETELQRARNLLYEFVISDPFQQVLLLSSSELAGQTPQNPNPPVVRNSQIRRRELTWTTYLQRLTTKNETISFFGPTVWGEADPTEPAPAAIELAEEFVAARLVYVERWVAEALAKLISADPEAEPLLPMWLADDVTIEPQGAVFLSSNKVAPLSAEEHEFLVGFTPGSCVPENQAVRSLLRQKILRRGIQVPLALRPLHALQSEILLWPDHPAKIRWSLCLQKIEDGRASLERSSDLKARRAAIEMITDALKQVGLDGRRESQSLYASRLPVNEDCKLSVKKVVLGKPVIDQLLHDLAPWYELWRDLAGCYATRLHTSLQKIWQSLGASPVPLPVFLRACQDDFLPFAATGGTGLMLDLDGEIQQAWRVQLAERWTQPTVKLTPDDTAFVRRNFRFQRMKSFDNMAPDFQIIAPDSEALAKGDWRLLLAEIHPDFTTWEHCFLAWCPDAKEYARDFFREGGHEPAVVFGPYPPYYTSAHVTLGIFPHTNQWTFVGVPPPQGAQTLRSAETMVVVTADDVKLLHQGHVVGSLLNTWSTALNTHRLELSGGREHSPRLEVGRAIVQRESWTIQPDDQLRQAASSGGYTSFAAFRKFRQEHQLPETVFVRGCLPNRLNLHKDVKPMFIDFRNPLLVDVLAKLAARFRRLMFTEMLPRAEDCWLEGPGGHYSCEFRTVVMATEASRTSGPDRTAATG